MKSRVTYPGKLLTVTHICDYLSETLLIALAGISRNTLLKIQLK